MMRVHYFGVGLPSWKDWSVPLDLSDGVLESELLPVLADQARPAFPPIDQDRVEAVITLNRRGSIQGRIQLRPLTPGRPSKVAGRFIVTLGDS